MKELDAIEWRRLEKENQGKERMVFDWDKAARILKEKTPEWAEAGLEGNFNDTSARIYYKNPGPMDAYFTDLASTFARPMLILTDSHVGKTEIPCYKMERECPDWDDEKAWPLSALKILGESFAY